jgi:hypothetical protein
MMRRMVHRFIAIALVFTAITGIAIAEIKNQQEIKPNGYTITMGRDSYIVITQFDKNQGVFITKRGTHKNAVVEGIPGKVISYAVKVFGNKSTNDKNVRKLVKKVLSSKEKYLKSKDTFVINLKPGQMLQYIR